MPGASRKSAAWAPVWRHRNTAYRPIVSVATTIAWPEPRTPSVPITAGSANPVVISTASITR